MLFQSQKIAVHFILKVHINLTTKKIAVGILPAVRFDNYYFGLVAFFSFIVHSKKKKEKKRIAMPILKPATEK